MTEPQMQVQESPVIRVVIDYAPAQRAMRVSWPQIDDVAKMGILEMAKLTLSEARTRAMMGVEESKIVAPPPGAISKFS